MKNKILLVLFLLAILAFLSLDAAAFTINGTTYNASGSILASVNVTVYVTNGMGTTLANFTSQSNSSGQYTVNVNESQISPIQSKFYQIIPRKFSGSNLTHIGSLGGQFPYAEFTNMLDLSAVNFYLKSGMTINISAVNASSTPINFSSYQVKDVKLGYPIDSYWGWQTPIWSSLVYVPADRNYSIMVYPNQNMPVSYNLNNASNYTAQILNVVFNISSQPKRVSGYVSLNGTTGAFNELNIISYLLEPGNMIFFAEAMPYNQSAWQQSTDFFNASSGFYNITLQGAAMGASMLLFAVARNSTAYYAAYKNISLLTSSNDTELNFTLMQMYGSPKNITVDNQGLQGMDNMNITSTQMRFLLLNSSNQTVNISAHIELEVDYTPINSSAFTFMLDLQPSDGGNIYLPLLNYSVKRMNIYSQSGAPMKKSFTASQISNGAVNITLRDFNPGSIGGEALTISVDLIKSNSQCNIPNYPSTCSLVGGAESEENFKPLTAVISGGLISFVMRDLTTNITVHYKNVDLLASGPPDALFDGDSNDSTSGSSLEQAWRFGSMGPEIYDEVLLGVPFDPALSPSTVKSYLGNLYDENWNIIWNETNSTNQDWANIPSDYSDFNRTLFNSTYPDFCNSTDSTLATHFCYVDPASNMVWIRIPHFSGVGPLTEGNNPPPGITLNSPANNTNYTTNTNITINFTATDIGPYTNFTCNITINGVVNISNIIAFNATPQVNVTTIANDAIYLWNVTCKDLQNNTNTSNVTRTFYVDTHGPSFDTAYFTLKNISSYTPSASSLFWMVVNWTDAVKDVASAVLYFNGAAVNSTASVTDGVKVNLSYTIPVTVNGTYNVSMWANDTLGWSNQTQNITITVQDITPPSVTLSEPVNGYNISSSNLTFTFSVSDYGSALMDCNLTINGTRIISFNDTTGNTTVVTGLANNVYYYNLTCIDDAGNVNNTLLNRVFTVDTVPPAGAPNITVTNLAGNMNLTWTTDSNAMRYGVYKSLSNITDANNATWIANTTATSYIDNLTTNATSYWYVVTSIDFAGNENRSLVNVTLGRNNATSSDTTIPKVPASITVTNSSNTATIYWANVTLDGSGNADYTGMQFKLWYKSGSTINLSNNASNNSMSLHTTVSPNSTTFSIPSSCGSSCVYTFAVTTLDDGSNENQTLINGSNMATVTLTYTNTSSSSTTTSSSSSSTTTPTTTPTDVIAKVSKAWSVLSADAETKMNVLNEKIPFEAVTFTLNAKSNNPSIDVSSINKPSTLATAPGAAYSYLKIDTKNLDDTLIKNAKVQFKVKLSWFTENNVKRNTIKLYRYTTTWTALETKELTVDNTYAYFEATLPGFSYFAISGIKTETAEESAPEVSTDEGTSLGSGQNLTAGEAGKDEKKGEQKQIQLSSTLWLWIGAAAVIIIALAIFFFMGKREVSVSEGKEEVKEQEKDINEIIDYISKESSKGIPRKSIERALLAKGWKIEAIKDAFNKSGKE